MNEQVKKQEPPTRKEINTVNEKAYDTAAAEYVAREEQDFSMKNDPKFTDHFLGRVKEGFPNLPAENMALLDVGVGPGVNLNLFANAGFQTYGVDISGKMIEAARRKSPGTNYTQRDYLAWKPPREFHGIMMKAFVHLFPKEIARQIIEKAWEDLEEGGALFLATTMHDTPSEGFEQKFKTEAKRYRKRWTRDEFEAFLRSVPGFQVVDFEVDEDPREKGKQWMNFTLRKVRK